MRRGFGVTVRMFRGTVVAVLYSLCYGELVNTPDKRTHIHTHTTTVYAEGRVRPDVLYIDGTESPPT